MKRLFIVLVVVGFACSFVCGTSAHAMKGLKKTVAVFDFKNDSGVTSRVKLGQDFSMQLSDALIQSGQFIVLTRKDLDVVMAEQDLASSGRFAWTKKTAKTGKIIPAQILIKGQITEFEENSSGGGQGLTIKGVTIGGSKSSAHIAVIVQLVDSTTGQIIDSKRVEGKAKSGGFEIGYSGEFDISSSNFKKTPLGKAVQMAIDRSVEYIAGKMKNIPWEGKVILVKEDGTVFVNSGENTGIISGTKLSILKEGEALIDPDTGLDLGSDTTEIARIEITEVQEKFSKAKILGTPSGTIEKGDIVQE